MRRFVVALLSMAALGAVSANAADMPVKEPVYKAPPPPIAYNWAGFYVGIEGGYAWGNASATDVTGYGGIAGYNFSYSPNGGVGDIYAGYNFQFDPFIVGIEGEVGYLGLDGSAQYPPYVGVRTAADSVAATDGGWYGAITGRVGWFHENFLVFAKGGYAFTGIKSSYTDTDPVGTTLVSGTDTSGRDGWTVGGGIEYMFWQNWIARLEYAYYDFGTASHTATSAAGATFVFDHKLSASVIKAGIAYKF